MLAQKLVLSYGTRLFFQLFQTAVGIVVARVAGPTVIGTVAYATAYVSMFMFLADLGIGSAHIKLLSEGNDEAKCIGTFVRIKLLLISLFTIVVLSYFSIQKFVLHHKFENPVHEKVILITLFAIILEQLFFIPKTTFAAKMEQAKQDIPDTIKLIIFQILRLIAVLLGFGAIAIAFSKLIAAIIMLPVFVYLFKDYPIGNFDKILAKKYISISLPIIIIIIVQTIIMWVDKVILQNLTSSKEVGFYVAGFRLGGFIRMIGSSIGLLFFPLFSQALAQNKFQEINDKIKKFERFNISFVFPFAIFGAIYSDLIVKLLLGAKYQHSIIILSIVTIAMFIMTFFQPYGNVLSGKGLFKLSAKLWIINLIIFVSIAYLFVSPNILNLKGKGMALALLIANFSIGTMNLILAKKKVPQLKILPALKIFIFAIIYSGIFAYIYSLLHGLKIKLIFAVLFFFGYWFLAYILRIITKDDWMLLEHLINLKKMKTYIKKEIFKK